MKEFKIGLYFVQTNGGDYEIICNQHCTHPLAIRGAKEIEWDIITFRDRILKIRFHLFFLCIAQVNLEGFSYELQLTELK